MEQNPIFDPKKWIDWVQEHENEPVPELALRYAARKDLPLKELLTQVKGRQTARNKLPTFYAHPEILYPDTMILEQCSSEEAAAHKAAWAEGKIVADLTGGLGIDTLAFARTAKKVFYCEPDTVRCAAAKYNFNVLGIQNVEVIQGTAAETSARLQEQADIFFLDPSRRSDSGKKVFRIEDLSPNLLELKDQLLTEDALIMVKLAPMLDIREGIRSLPETIRVEVISRKDECRELLFFLAKKTAAPDIICIDTGNVHHTFNFQPKEEVALPLPIGEPEEYLFEPNASIRKAGPWRSICKTYGIKMLHPNSHLFTGSTPLVNFPGRMFRIEQVLPHKKEKIKSALDGHPAQMVFYNFPVNAADVTKSLGIKSGEPKYLFFTSTEAQRTVVLLAERILVE
jgi:16S rRNA G966 N2-methylase RsmD